MQLASWCSAVTAQQLGAAPYGSCAQCGGDLPPPKRKGGMPRRYCRDECRYAAAYERRPVTWDSGVELAAIPADPLTQERRTLTALAETLAGRPAAPPEDQLVQALIESHRLSFVLRRLAVDVRDDLAERSTAFGVHIAEGLRQFFPAQAEELDL